MTEIIEIVFEGAQLKKIVELLNRSLSNSILKDYTVSTDSSQIDLHSKAIIFDSIKKSSDGSFYFNFLDYQLNNTLLTRAGFQILKYDKMYDLNLHVEQREINQKISIVKLQQEVQAIAEELEVSEYYCGYEPAIDKKTRLFFGRVK